jgi:hypothetical protein
MRRKRTGQLKNSEGGRPDLESEVRNPKSESGAGVVWEASADLESRIGTMKPARPGCYAAGLSPVPGTGITEVHGMTRQAVHSPTTR